MRTLYIERSTGECRNGDWVGNLDLAERPERIVVGTGPGSFAGIRSALAFAQGYALGSGCEVLGLPSPCGIVGDLLAAEPAEAAREKPLAVVGDARQGKIWIALFRGHSLERPVFQVDSVDLPGSVPGGYAVVTPDEKRIGERLRAEFGSRYLGGRLPTAEGLRAFAEANPSVLVSEPLPIYLNPAVRPVGPTV